MKYELTLNHGLPQSQSAWYDDSKEDAVFVLKCRDDCYWVDHSSFVAKKLRQISMGLYSNAWLDEHPAIGFHAKYLTKPHNATITGPNAKDSLNAVWLQNCIFYSMVEQYGLSKVRSSNTTLNLEDKGYEDLRILTIAHSSFMVPTYQHIMNPNSRDVGESKRDNIGK